MELDEAPTGRASGAVGHRVVSDSEALRAAARHHAVLLGELDRHVEELLAAVESGDERRMLAGRRAVVAFCDGRLLPHARAEEASVYPAAATDGRALLLVEALVDEHRAIGRLVDVVRSAYHPVRAAAAAEGLRVLFEAHLVKEDQLVMPLVAAVPGLSLAELMAGLHELLLDDPATRS